MKQMINSTKNEQGSVLVIALVILVLLTLMGISVTTTSDIDIQIAKNEQEYVEEFYVADSAWRQGIEWLDSQSMNPPLINTGLFLGGSAGDALNVRNYGGGSDPNNNFEDDTEDGTLSVGTRQINYWYKIAYPTQAAMSGTPASSLTGAERVLASGFIRYDFVITAITGPQNPKTITVTVSKFYPEETY
jgi:Tfp pilus assembly protein PilX